MAKEKWSDESSALFVADINTRVLPKALAWMFGCVVIVFGGTMLLTSDSFWGITFGASLLPLYPMMEYVVVLISVSSKLNLVTGRTMFFADRAGYRAKLKANPALRSFAPTRNQKLIAAGIVVVLAIGLMAAVQG